MTYAVAAPAPPAVPILGASDRFAVGRVFCVGRNYADHAKEMGAPAEPIFFMKPASSVVTDPAAPYPADTAQVDHEVELVLALGAGGRPATADAASALIYGYAAGVDLTRRDVQAKAKAAGQPWEAAKAFDASAPIGPIRRRRPGETLSAGRIHLTVNDETRQDADLADMILDPGALLVALARVWTLAPGDLVFTGTPAGVGPIAVGDRVVGVIEDVGEVAVTLG